MTLPVKPPVLPMLAKLARELPRKEGLIYEPKWDGFRSIVFRDGDDVELGSRNAKPLTRYFPELVEAIKAQFPPKAVVDGEIVVTGPDGLDFDALQNRIHPAASRVGLLSHETPASFVAFDVLALDDEDLRDQPFADRRARLEAAFAKATPPIHVTPATTDPAVAEDWFERFEGAGLDGVVAKSPTLAYKADERVMIKVKHERTADCVVAGFRWHKSGGVVGSLLLGLYDDAGDLHHVGVIGAFPMAQRKALVDELAPLRENALDGHPWAAWADAITASGNSGRMPGGLSRWSQGKDLSWEPLRAERVVEVNYEQVQSGRFRHQARFRRWRPDRDPRSCTYDQLETPTPELLANVFGSG